ncbi:MAG: plasmid mobilization protein [Janthinobacterium lividum]
MAKLEIEIAPEEQKQIQKSAERASLSVNEWIRQQLLRKPLPAFITDEGEVFEIPDLPEDLGRACALASEATLRKFWDTPEEDEAWQHEQA